VKVDPDSFYAVLSAAVRDLTEFGFDSVERVEGWIRRIRDAARAAMVPEWILDDRLKETFRTAYRRSVERGGLLRHHPGVSRYTLDRVAPRLRLELDRRIAASANLIKLNREAAIESTLRRFAGWSTSIPLGGTDAADRTGVKTEIRKSMASLPFQERRVLIDQAHKFAANLSDIVSKDAGAIAAVWNSHWRQAGYDYREDHKERDGVVYAIRGNRALDAGLMRLDGHACTDEITTPGEEVYCRCWYTYVYSLRDLPPGMVTERGREDLARLRATTA